MSRFFSFVCLAIVGLTCGSFLVAGDAPDEVQVPIKIPTWRNHIPGEGMPSNNSGEAVRRVGDAVPPPSETPIDLSKNLRLDQRHVIAIAMTEVRTLPISGEWKSWSFADQDPGIIDSTGRRQIGSVWYPAIGPYDFADPAAQEYVLQYMKLLGIDTISCHVWKTPELEPSRWATLSSFVPLVQAWGLHAFARTGSLGAKDRATWIAAQRRWEELFRPVTIRIDNRPVHSFFGITGFKVADVSAYLDTYPADQRPFLLMKCHSLPEDIEKWKGVVEGMYDWITWARSRRAVQRDGMDAWLSYDTMVANNGLDLDRVTTVLNAQSLRLYLHSATPGFDDSPVRGWGHGVHIIDRNDGRTYQYLWDQALATKAEAVVIPTWNDYPEGSIIEPTAQFGTKYVEMTRSYVAKFKGTTAGTVDLRLPIWIYRIRKSTTDQVILAAMDRASALIRDDQATAAYELVKPQADALQVIDVVNWNKIGE